MGIAIIHTGQIPESISAMVYVLPKKGMWFWTVWLVVVSVLTFAPAVQLLDTMNVGFLGFLPMACLAFVAVWPLWDLDHRRWHYALAVAGGILSQICVALINPWWLIAWILWVVIFVWKTKDRPLSEWKWSVFLSECICYITLVGSLLFN